jgi:hypothetical protein
MKNIISLTVLFFARNKKQFCLINGTEIQSVNRFVTTKRNETRSKQNLLTALLVPVKKRTQTESEMGTRRSATTTVIDLLCGFFGSGISPY